MMMVFIMYNLYIPSARIIVHNFVRTCEKVASDLIEHTCDGDSIVRFSEDLHLEVCVRAVSVTL